MISLLQITDPPQLGDVCWAIWGRQVHPDELWGKGGWRCHLSGDSRDAQIYAHVHSHKYTYAHVHTFRYIHICLDTFTYTLYVDVS